MRFVNGNWVLGGEEIERYEEKETNDYKIDINKIRKEIEAKPKAKKGQKGKKEKELKKLFKEMNITYNPKS